MSQLHRFHDCVALYFGTGETIYFTPKQAGEIAKALNACKRNIIAKDFLCSDFGSVELPEPLTPVSMRFKQDRS